MISDVCIYVGKGTVAENDLREQALGSDVIKLLLPVPPDVCVM
jgi:hypothetical protein